MPRAPWLRKSELARLPPSSFSTAAETSVDWLFSRVLLNMPGPPSALLPKALAWRAGVTVRRRNVWAVACATLHRAQVKRSDEGAGVKRRTVDLPAAFAGISEKLVSLSEV